VNINEKTMNKVNSYDHLFRIGSTIEQVIAVRIDRFNAENTERAIIKSFTDHVSDCSSAHPHDPLMSIQYDTAMLKQQQ